MDWLRPQFYLGLFEVRLERMGVDSSGPSEVLLSLGFLGLGMLRLMEVLLGLIVDLWRHTLLALVISFPSLFFCGLNIGSMSVVSV